ncbi:unnamed protein product [Gongylonema pulchrum]|uniref:Transmembrane protein n=1 Tax=Gongylonema pulchrum TaxID=637853 RepID=A0A183EMX8_9BILA|nr:unnamed protein product [Gongylonema pulchrum]
MHQAQNAQHLLPTNLQYNGTSQSEVLLFQLIGPVSILLRNIAVPWIFVGFRFAVTNGFCFVHVKKKWLKGIIVKKMPPKHLLSASLEKDAAN